MLSCMADETTPPPPPPHRFQTKNSSKNLQIPRGVVRAEENGWIDDTIGAVWVESVTEGESTDACTHILPFWFGS